jgi:hypothetical protein
MCATEMPSSTKRFEIASGCSSVQARAGAYAPGCAPGAAIRHRRLGFRLRALSSTRLLDVDALLVCTVGDARGLARPVRSGLHALWSGPPGRLSLPRLFAHCVAMHAPRVQLDNGLQALLVYDPLMNENSWAAKQLAETLNRGGLDFTEPAVVEDGAIALALGFGSWSDPSHLQARPQQARLSMTMPCPCTRCSTAATAARLLHVSAVAARACAHDSATCSSACSLQQHTLPPTE